MTMPLSRFDPATYREQLEHKVQRVMAGFADFEPPQPLVFPSAPEGYRMRAEFRIWHEGEDLFYAMFNPGDPRTPLRVDEFPISGPRIQLAMQALRETLLPAPTLRRKLFQVEFLETLQGELLITLVYHRPLDAVWQSAAQELESTLSAHIVGRSRKQKIVLSRDHVEESLCIHGRRYRYRQYEGSFTQPNAGVNMEMIGWACDRASDLGGDLLELYCGNGNFTLPMCRHFDRALATEVSKRSIEAALYNRDLNGIDNLQLARLSAQEISAALAGEREFRRLRQLPTALADYNFSTVFLDPPRAGLDAATAALAAGFEHIIYISCNPETLTGNLRQLCATHSLDALALFDQFPYTDHMECGAFLRRRARP